MEKTRKVIVVEGLESAGFLLKFGKSEIIIIETPCWGERESYENMLLQEKGWVFKIL